MQEISNSPNSPKDMYRQAKIASLNVKNLNIELKSRQQEQDKQNCCDSNLRNIYDIYFTDAINMRVSIIKINEIQQRLIQKCRKQNSYNNERLRLNCGTQYIAAVHYISISYQKLIYMSILSNQWFDYFFFAVQS
ncbi:hypothetical protein TTHERM_000125549 (macronuclear) [Tetrahymena thermophila SB210]|uniref:Uncharacterized protein n=1 Tax=Tetrahymena thermophila (strain SB210) TaxID=312017 RepID=W7XI62_TETTS|nr:hypothetical protein TTHERM_000125549 [Tetrahymena thermophila SB210]EWS74341.1 hypothetical protein TTHERM_000125549 [Tetrahymena thermophila SB210]|eukprot:XP_012653162.1 hypothetical protein TTHERM_000125549 [Tetrahymena thermophila SB210]